MAGNNQTPIESYGNVQIFQVMPNYYYYFVNPNAIRGKGGKQLINTLLADDAIEEIMYIGSKKPIKVYHSKYNMCNTNITVSEVDATAFITELAVKNKRIINQQQPLLDGALPDGSRLNATIPPASVDGPTLTIRKFKQNTITALDLIGYNTITPAMAAFIWTCVEGLNVKPANMIFAGGTGSGKTTNLNAFTMFIPFDSRIITIEDTPELHIVHEHLVRLTTIESAKVGMKELLINCLRMRPDRILVGEVRGEEAKSLFTAMNTGHEGCMGTLHANTTKEALSRVTQDPMSVPPPMLSGLDIVVMQQRIISGKQHSRHITEIAEIASTPSGSELPKFNILFKWDPVKKICVKTGIPSRFREKVSKAAGITPKQFDEIVNKREQLIASAKANNYNINQLIQMVMQNSY